MTKEGVTKIERREGGLSIENAKKIAAVLNVDYTELIDGPKTDDERELLDLFRRLPDDQKTKVLGYAEAKIDEQD